MTQTIHPVDERLPAGKLAALGLQHVLVMYAGAVAVPLIVGRALKLTPAAGGPADLGRPVLLRHRDADPVARRHPVVRHPAAGDDGRDLRRRWRRWSAMANANSGPAGAQLIFGAIIGAGVISILIAPMVSRMLRFFPPVVTGTIIAVIGISLMRVGINWIFGNPFGPTAPALVDPEHAKWLADVAAAAGLGAVPPLPKGLALAAIGAEPQVRRPRPASASPRSCWCRSC